jgi:putative PIN family toxin of toxin-antitoxin system
MSSLPRIVIDTNVLVSALRSSLGASFRVLQAVGRGQFEHVVTVPLVMEYEDVLRRPKVAGIPAAMVGDVIDYLCATGVQQSIHFLWRPKLPDPKDDMVLEAAVNGGCSHIVTHNLRDFDASRAFRIDPVTPAAFLTLMLEPPR